MKNLTTCICVLALFAFGWIISPNTNESSSGMHITQTVSAGTMNSSMPYGILNNRMLGTPASDTIRVTDTIRVPDEGTKYIKVPYKTVEHDTVYVPLIFIARPDDGERHPLANDEIDSSISKLVKASSEAD